jgi:hypothetical protein
VDVLLAKACCLSVPGCHGVKPRNEGRFFMFLITEIFTGVYVVTKITKIWATVLGYSTWHSDLEGRSHFIVAVGE